MKSSVFGGAKGFPVFSVLFVASGVSVDVLAELVIADLWFCISRFAPSSDNMNTLEVFLDFPKKCRFRKPRTFVSDRQLIEKTSLLLIRLNAQLRGKYNNERL